MGQADLSSMGNLMKPMVMAAMKLAQKGKTPDKKKAKVEAKMKMKVKVKHG
jgi:hypothetical protein